jgi:hypothetical protein
MCGSNFYKSDISWNLDRIAILQNAGKSSADIKQYLKILIDLKM